MLFQAHGKKWQNKTAMLNNDLLSPKHHTIKAAGCLSIEKLRFYYIQFCY